MVDYAEIEPPTVTSASLPSPGAALGVESSASMTMSIHSSSTADNRHLRYQEKTLSFDRRQFKLSLQRAVRHRLIHYAGPIESSLSVEIEKSVADSIKLALNIIKRSWKVSRPDSFFSRLTIIWVISTWSLPLPWSVAITAHVYTLLPPNQYHKRSFPVLLGQTQRGNTYATTLYLEKTTCLAHGPFPRMHKYL